MPLDKTRAPVAQLSARKTAQMIAATRGAGFNATAAAQLVEAFAPVMVEDMAAATVADLIKATEDMAVKLTGASADAEMIREALQQMIDEGGDEAPPTALADLKTRFMSSFGAACLAKMYAGDPLKGANMRSAAQPKAQDLNAQLTDAIYCKLVGKTPTIGARYAGIRGHEAAELVMNAQGVKASGFGPSREMLLVRAFETRSDFPQILGDAMGRAMLDMYQAATSGLKAVSFERSLPDFRARYGLRATGALEFKQVAEAGEFTHGTIQESGESYRLNTFGRVWSVSRQALINDDLGAFVPIAKMMAEGAAQMEGKSLAALITANSGAGPTMSDGQPVFHTTHRNIAGTGTTITVAGLTIGRTSMRRQTDQTAGPINVTPVYLIVPPELETLAEQVLAEINAAEVAEVNPFSGKLTLVVDPYLTSAIRWYLASEPGRPGGLEHAYLDGARGPQLFRRDGFEVDGTQFKGRLDFGCGFMDWRGWWMNPGA